MSLSITGNISLSVRLRSSDVGLPAADLQFVDPHFAGGDQRSQRLGRGHAQNGRQTHLLSHPAVRRQRQPTLADPFGRSLSGSQV